ncbi:MAG: hypothetical protein ACLSH8_00380 [Zhenhengia sp.]|uniref:hypothetical protein n=1 Tax=Zhenhengia sp. TaxID=2944208 RepID=UPI00399334FA
MKVTRIFNKENTLNINELVNITIQKEVENYLQSLYTYKQVNKTTSSNSLEKGDVA